MSRMSKMEQHSEIASEDTNSICDEERVRKLFVACDGDGDGYIDSQDLMSVCRKLNLEDSIDELMRELGADETGRISYEDFLSRRLALRSEINAIRKSSHHGYKHMPDYFPTSSDNSLGAGSVGKHDCWEFDSGARDLSPEPQSLHKLVEVAAVHGGIESNTSPGNLLDLANKLHLAALTSLKREISDLTGRLHAAVQERQLLEAALSKLELENVQTKRNADRSAQRFEERLTELHCVIAELSRKLEQKHSNVIAEEDDDDDAEPDDVDADLEADVDVDAVEGFAANVNPVDDAEVSPLDDGSGPEEPNATPSSLRNQSATQSQPEKDESDSWKIRRPWRHKSEELSYWKNEVCSSNYFSEQQSLRQERDQLRLRVAELKQQLDCLADGQVLQHGTGHGAGHSRHADGPTSVSESDVLDYDPVRRQLEIEIESLHSRLAHVQAHNNVLAITLEDSKNQSDRLSLLLGKYESNAIALRQALGLADRAITAYDCLVALLESQLSLTSEEGKQMPSSTVLENRRAAERAALLFLSAEHNGRLAGYCDWAPGDELRLRETISRLKVELSRVRSTEVQLERPHVDIFRTELPLPISELRKLDLETAVLMQELMALREDKAELAARLYLLEKERDSLELRLGTTDIQRQVQDASIEHLQAQLQDAVAKIRKCSLTEPKERAATGAGSSDEETELSAALRREGRLKEKLHELVTTLDKVSRNSEQRYSQSAELVNDLRRANGALVQTLERSKKKYQCRLKKMEQQMLAMAERHSAQVRGLKQKIPAFEENMKCTPQLSGTSNETAL